MIYRKNFKNTKAHQKFLKKHLPPFSELIISWNANRPTQGQYLFYVRVFINHWSSWLLYAVWGSNGQMSFSENIENIKLHQDTLEIIEKQATGFQIKIITEGNASFSQLRSLHVYANGQKQPTPKIDEFSSLLLPVSGLSQMILQHPRNQDLCSPTATTAVVRYLTKNPFIDPLEFAQKSYDQGFDIFGNWVFNIAQAAAELGKGWNCWVERLEDFDSLYQRLLLGTPVVVSVRGPLQGSALPYAKGHLIAVIGYDATTKQVLCMDPAFPEDSKTLVRYELSNFMESWERRNNIAYIFERTPNVRKGLPD